MATLTMNRSWRKVLDEIKEFMWNPKTREFMGRTGTSWALIILFYVVFYAVLSAIFVLCLYVMLQTIDKNYPKYQDRLPYPGLMIRPNIPSLQITFNGQNTTWKQYVDGIDSALKGYDQSTQQITGIDCPFQDYFRQDNITIPKQACRFTRDLLGSCSGLNDTSYGYANGMPCVLIKMNRVVKFFPEIIPSLSNTSITIKCTSKDDNLLGNITYFPSITNQSLGSIDLKYYPYYGQQAQPTYTQPFVAVQFTNLTKNVDHNVQCLVNAANIATDNDRDKFQGRVYFTVRSNS
ncbi:sodium/potassium-transporting ATPase subunit beta-2-like [Rana temporaria]|uniref:sodium/potassium-transporting ATPase subunit beta-2-like n=1 Tax=Rana temporaria TaxID=8407 RepID=UPI001AAD957D|nr:sodium/potassium-transporting ATPase subunit beta-2-like [Rana temporaria]